MESDINYEYVIIGTERYNFIMARDRFQYWVLFMIIFVLILIIALVVWMLYRQSDTNVFVGQPLNTVPYANLETINTLQGAVPVGAAFHGPNDGSLFGDATVCNANVTSTWNVSLSTCNCIEPYWGSTCNRNSYDNKYIGAGNYDPSFMVITPPNILPPIMNKLLECTALCDTTTNCNGVVWESTSSLPINGICTMFEELTTAQFRTIPYPLGVDSTIYVNQTKESSLVYLNRVFLYSGALPLRYWLKDLVVSMFSNLLTVSTNIVYLLPFFPTGSVNQTFLVGVYSLIPFTINDYDTLLLGGDTPTTYIDQGGQLQLPLGWQYQDIWVMYK